MKKIIAVFMLLFISMVAIAQYFELDHKLQCNDTKTIISIITDKFKEEPFWSGRISDNVNAMLFVNLDTSSWSYILVSPTKSCVLNTGEGFSVRQPVRSNNRSYGVDNSYSM